jgi:hypothetical protein
MESLLLSCGALASPTMCRFIPALSDDQILTTKFKPVPQAADFLLHASVVGERPARVGDFSSHDREERLRFWQIRRGNLEDVL